MVGGGCKFFATHLFQRQNMGWLYALTNKTQWKWWCFLFWLMSARRFDNFCSFLLENSSHVQLPWDLHTQKTSLATQKVRDYVERTEISNIWMKASWAFQPTRVRVRTEVLEVYIPNWSILAPQLSLQAWRNWNKSSLYIPLNSWTKLKDCSFR